MSNPGSRLDTSYVLKAGVSQAKGREARKSNFGVARLLANLLKSSLGPRSLDKMLVQNMASDKSIMRLGNITITNDGATILRDMEIIHPAAKMMRDIAKITDKEVGDGTTSAVVFAGSLLEKADELIDRKVHPIKVADGYKKAYGEARKILKTLAIKVDPSNLDALVKVARTSMNSKYVSDQSEFLASKVAEAVQLIAEYNDDNVRVDIGNVKVATMPGRPIAESQLVRGVILEKGIVHSGMPKKIKNAKIALLSVPLQVEKIKTKFTSKMNINSPDQMEMFVDEESIILKEMIDKIVAVGANVVFCHKEMDEISQDYLAKAGILAMRKIKWLDMERLAKATGGKIVPTLDGITSSDLGYAEFVEERKIEDGHWVFIEGCRNPKSVALFLRGGTLRVVEELERSVHDALCVVRDVMQQPYIVLGAGAPEAELAFQLNKWAQTLTGKEQLAAKAYAEAIEVIPLTLAENAGMNTIDTIVELRAKHSKNQKTYGVNVKKRKIEDARKFGVYEPLAVKEQVISAATEAATMLLRIDDVLAASSKYTGKPTR
jgi:thermosome